METRPNDCRTTEFSPITEAVSSGSAVSSHSQVRPQCVQLRGGGTTECDAGFLHENLIFTRTSKQNTTSCLIKKNSSKKRNQRTKCHEIKINKFNFWTIKNCDSSSNFGRFKTCGLRASQVDPTQTRNGSRLVKSSAKSVTVDSVVKFLYQIQLDLACLVDNIRRL